MLARSWLALPALALAACATTTIVGHQGTVPPPDNLVYRLDPSGDPSLPAGILLQWDDVSDPALASYRIYSRGSTGTSFGLRGETTSNTFHDNGVPHLQYYVTSVDDNGDESDPSATITVDERLQLEAPTALTSISLNGAIQLDWTDNAFLSDPQRFEWYRVYSASYDLDQGSCGTDWALEGTTVSPEFLAAALTNGEPRCYGISAISVEGYESLWSPLRQDTPRPDARNVLVYAVAADTAQSGFRFWDDVNQDGVGQPTELGLVQDGTRADVDFRVFRDPADSSLWLVPVFSGTSLQRYGSTPVNDLTDIDFAPAAGYTRDSLPAVPGYGYVFEIIDGSVLHYGALRVTHVNRSYVIFDWSVQTDPGNPELIAHGNLSTAVETGSLVPGAR